MQVGKFKDKSINCAIFLLKIVGLWMSMNSTEERQRRLTLTWTFIALFYSTYLNVVDITHNLDNLSHCIFSAITILCVALSMFKIVILSFHKMEFKEIVLYASKNFWNVDYEHEEKILFTKCQSFCQLWIIVVCCLAQGTLGFYVLSPINVNIGKNKSERVLPFKMWVDLPLSETPYYEIVYTIQAVCVYQVGAAYICSDCFLCMLNMHVICQFRMLHRRLSNMWPSTNEQMNQNEYTNKCYRTLIKCIEKHQSLLEFCNKLENVYTIMILGHMVIFSLLMCFDTYEVFLAKVPTTTRLIFFFHMVGSYIHIVFFTYSCNGLIEESMNIATATYSLLWTVLPTNNTGIMIRRNINLMIMRSLNPCCLTAGGFFPISMRTATALMSSSMSYFTLMRERSNAVE
ncbi:Odorant receptor 30a [Anthophora quadrimaculata]